MKLNNNICNKIIDHGYKYPCNHCFGYLISDSSGSVKRCIPALHIWLLNPGLELSYEMLKATLSKEENIIGFYYIDNNIPNNKKKQEIDLDSLSFIYKLILSDLNKVLSPIIIKANSNSLQDTVISQPFEIYTFNNDKQKFCIKSDDKVEVNLEEINTHLLSKQYLSLFDFDDHLNDCKINWL